MLSRVWISKHALRREIICLLTSAKHPVSMTVIEQALDVAQPRFVMMSRISHCLDHLIRCGIVEEVTLQRPNGIFYYGFRLAEGISEYTDSNI